MKIIDISKRTSEAEIMDNFDLQGTELEKTLYDLEKINKWLGGNKITVQGIKALIKNCPVENTFNIVDVGCGNGAMLREIADLGRAKKINFKLIGIDANPYAIEIAEKLSEYYPEIEYAAENLFDNSFRQKQFDIILCTLTLHHFKNEDITAILESFCNQSRIGIVINDLHRSRQAYYLFKAFCKVFIRNNIAKEDGLTSVLRGFKKKDLKNFALLIPSRKQKIKWKWAYRYQWIIEK